MKKHLLTLTTLLLCSSVSAGDLTENFISSAKFLLPKKIDVSNIKVNFKRMNENQLGSPCDREGFIYGKYSDGEITLSEQLKNHLTPNEEVQFSCKHKNYYKTALSTLLHEYLHAYEDTLSKNQKLHNQNVFLSLGFWNLKKSKKNLNTYAERSPNLYEYSSPKEFLAVNFEYFLLDPEYKCRRPNLYSAYQESFSHTPFQNIECNSLSEISTSDTQRVELVNLDLKNVREIHYLFASKGQAMMSRWGHSMYKLVLCDQNWSLEKCRQRGKFLVVGFLAQVSDVSINAIKGILGQYPSDMTVTSLDAMKRQYNRAELRDLESIPLDFNKDEKERFLNHLIRIYWEYSGKYYFFSNNCADEAFKLIQIAKNKSDIYKKGVLTPIGIYKYIKENNLSKDFSFTNRELNIENGLLYSSFAPNLDLSFDNLKKQFEKSFREKIKVPNIQRRERNFKVDYKTVRDIQQYSKLPTLKRREIIKAILKKKDRKNFLDLFAIESQANYVTNNELLSKMQSISSKQDSDEETREIFTKIVELKNIIIFGTNSENKGYGIPQSGDLESTISPEVFAAEEELKEVKNLLQEKYKTVFQEEFFQMEEANYNKTIIKEALRSVL